MKRLALIATVLGLFAAAPAGAACAADETCLNDPQLASVTGRVWLDRDGDGEHDPDEQRMGGMVFADYNGDGQRQEREPVAVTEPDGRYALSVDPRRLPEYADTVAVRWVSDWSIGDGFDPQCLGRCVQTVRVAAGQQVPGPWFAVVLGAELHGTIWDDRNENGRREQGEEGADRQRVFLDDNGNGKRDAGEPTSARTTPSGRYSLPVPTRYLAAGGTLPPLVAEESAGVNCTAPADCAVTGLQVRSREVTEADLGVARPVVIFTHGYGGAHIKCGDKTLWFALPRPHLFDIRLGVDGENLRDGALAPGGSVSPLGSSLLDKGTACSENARVDGLVMNVGPADIYGSASRHFRDITFPNRHYDYVWDWRKDPKTAVDGLDVLIEKARREHGVSRVVLVGHSQGGLVMRHYVDDPGRAAKVSRAVTVGTPYWGSPKTILPLAAGMELPGLSMMDLMMDNEGLKAASRTLPGHFSLVPAFGYGQWLSVNGNTLDMAGVQAYMESIGVHPQMYRNGAAEHGRVLDHFRDNGVDFHVIVGGGVATIGKVELDHRLGDLLKVTWTSGDETVPQRSAAHDTPPDRLHVVCGLTHVPITAAPETTELMDEFLIRAEPMKPGAKACPWVAEETSIYLPDLTMPTARASRARTEPRVTVGGRSLTLDEAEQAGHVQVVRFGATTKIVSRGGARVELPKDATAVVRQLSDRGAGAPKHYVGGKAVARDTKAPVTKASWRGGKLVLRARDASKVAATFVIVGGKKRLYRKPVRVSRSARFGSVDVWGNAETPRRVPRR